MLPSGLSFSVSLRENAMITGLFRVQDSPHDTIA